MSTISTTDGTEILYTDWGPAELRSAACPPVPACSNSYGSVATEKLTSRFPSARNRNGTTVPVCASTT